MGLGWADEASGDTLGGQGLDDGIPSALEGLDTFLELFVLSLTLFLPFSAEVILNGARQGGGAGSRVGENIGDGRDDDAGPQTSVLLLELDDSALEI